MEGSPRIRMSSIIDTKDAMLISCFPSVGMVSSIVAHYLIEHLDLRFVGSIRDSRIPAVCLVQDGRPMPPIRIYAGEPVCKVDMCDKVLLVVSEFKVGGELAFDLCDALLEWSDGAGISATVLIDAFAKKGSQPPNSAEGEPIVEYEDTPEIDFVGVGAIQDATEVIEKMDIPLLEQGLIGGMTGVLLGEGRRAKLNMLSILVEADPRFPDARAAAALIEKLDTLLPVVELDTTPLVEEAERIEEQIRSMMEHQLQLTEDASEGSSNSMLYG